MRMRQRGGRRQVSARAPFHVAMPQSHGWGSNRQCQLLGVSENPDKIPEHKRRMYANVQVKVTDDVRGDKGSPKDCSCLKSCESFYTCPRAPFYREIKGLYIPKTPSNSKNIPSVNMYTNVFYILYIYKPATSSHAKPRLLRRRL
jgi:hypothetical protein